MHRRDFLRLGLQGALLAGLAPAPRAADEPGQVVAIGNLIPPGQQPRSNRDALPAPRLHARLHEGLRTLLGPDPWARLAGPDDTVAIKINGLAAPHLSPRTELVEALVAGLRTAGVLPGRIILWDRTTREVVRSGFPVQTEAGAVRAYGTDALRGGGYGETLETSGSVGSLVSRIVTDYATVLINVGVLKDHDLAGLSAGLKNLYGAIHNPNRYHDQACDPYVAEVAALPSIRARLRLTVIDAVLAQAQGGPAYVADWIWPCDRVLLAEDPVACDQIAWDLLERQRTARGLPSLAEAERAPRWIARAAELGLGRCAAVRAVEV